MTDAPTPEARFDPVAGLVLATALGAVFVLIIVRFGVSAAIAGLVALLAIDIVGAFIWTCVQQIAGRSTVPFGTRFLRNTRDFYIRLLAVFTF